MKEKYLINAKKILNSVNNEVNSIYFDNILNILNNKNYDTEKLFSDARKKRNSKIGEKIFVRASIEFSNICKKDCNYCGMACSNKHLSRYQMNEDELKSAIYEIREHNIKQLHLVSGESNSIDLDVIGRVIEFAKDLGINSTLVLGNKDKNEFQKLFNYGASRYIMKFETSNNEAYKLAKGDNTLIERIADLLMLRDIGFKIGTGCIVGLPNTSINDLARDLILLKEINPNMSSCSVFSPNKESKFKNYIPGDKDTALKFIALMRLCIDRSNLYIPSSSSFGLDGQIKAINAGANILSVHFTPDDYANKFSMYKSNNRIKRKLEEINEISQLTNMVVSDYE